MTFLCLGDAGYTSGEAARAAAAHVAALIGETAASAVAIDNATQLVKNYRDQRDIANRSIVITREQQNELETVFWPREDEFLAEFSVGEPLETAEALGSRYAGRLVASVAGAFAQKFREVRAALRRYNTSQNEKQLQDLLLARSVAIANARVYGRSIGFAEHQARYDVNVNRRMQAVQLGRGLINEAMTLLQAAGGSVGAAGEQIKANLGDALRGFDFNETRRRNAVNASAFFDERDSARSISGAPGVVGTQNNAGFSWLHDALTNPESSNTMQPDNAFQFAKPNKPLFGTNQNNNIQVNDTTIGGGGLANGGWLTILPGQLTSTEGVVTGRIDLGEALPPTGIP